MINKLRSLFGNGISIYTDRMEGMNCIVFEPASSEQMSLLMLSSSRIAEIAEENNFEKFAVYSPSRERVIDFMVSDYQIKITDEESIEYKTKYTKYYRYGYCKRKEVFFRRLVENGKIKNECEYLDNELLIQYLYHYLGRSKSFPTLFFDVGFVNKELELGVIRLPATAMMGLCSRFILENYAIKLRTETNQSRNKFIFEPDLATASLPKDNFIFVTSNFGCKAEGVLLTCG